MTRPPAADPFAITGVSVRLRDPLPDAPSMESAVSDLIGQLAETKRALAEQEKEGRGEMQRLLLDVIEVGDAFERIFAAAREAEGRLEPATKRWLANFAVVQRLLLRILTDHGVAEIETLDRSFDPHWHKAIDAVAAPGIADGSIAQTVRKGYVWGGLILRKTEVLIARNDAGASVGAAVAEEN